MSNFSVYSAVVVMLMLLNSTLAAKSPTETKSEACSRNPSLSFCKDGQREQGRSENDKKACSSLKNEYSQNCKDKETKRRDEFCAAYENVCFYNNNNASTEADTNKQSEANQDTDGSAKGRHADNDSLSPKDFIEFCKNYKQRFLYVCPDPVRFGERAAVFCPIYSERCQLPLPPKPVLPQAMLNVNNNMSLERRLCTQYRSFAASYCGNQFALQYSFVRDNCRNYQRFCNSASMRFQ